jgi:hypothetical protein
VTLQTIDVSPIAAWESAFAEERLGPSPQWDGYSDIEDQRASERVYANVGYIHAQSAEVGRGVIAIGQKLREIKEDLPHGQFVACVKAEFGWTPRWAQQLMRVADHFSNANSSLHLPSSAKVLALLAAAGADDATVEQAAQEGWTVKQAKQNLGGEKQRQRTVIDEALKAFRLSEEARSLAANALRITTRQLMDELGADELPKGKQHVTDTATFVKDQEGWIKFTMQQPIDVPATATRTQADLFSDAPQADEEIVPIAEGAARLGKKLASFRIGLTPSQLDKRGNPKGNGWTAYPHPTRGKCILRKVA